MEEEDTVPRWRRRIRMMTTRMTMICHYWQQDGKRRCKAGGVIRKMADAWKAASMMWAFEWEKCDIKVPCKYQLPVECT